MQTRLSFRAFHWLGCDAIGGSIETITYMYFVHQTNVTIKRVELKAPVMMMTMNMVTDLDNRAHGSETTCVCSSK